MNKRDFLAWSFATAATTAAMSLRAREKVAGGKGWPSALKKALLPITAVIYDERYSDARAFALELNQMGATLFETRRDVGSLWYHGLRKHLEAHSGRVAGFTPYSDVYVIHASARENRLRMLYEACHDCRGRAEVNHHIRKGFHPEVASALNTSSALWLGALARSLVFFSPGDNAGSPRTITTTVQRAVDHPGVLVSWLLGTV